MPRAPASTSSQPRTRKDTTPSLCRRSARGRVPQLHPRRLGKLDKEIREIDNAEQYVLIVLKEGWYECFTCVGKMIYLYPGQVWKYGVTRKGDTTVRQANVVREKLAISCPVSGKLRQVSDSGKNKNLPLSFVAGKPCQARLASFGLPAG